MKNNNINGFSLIELSIVLIIIGLLVAGITGGRSLIDSAKLQAGIREMNSLKQAVYGFYGKYGRLPGDIKHSGIIGRYFGSTYKSNYFSNQGYEGDYANKNISNMVAPWVELYTSEFYDFKPTTDIAKLSNSHILYPGETHPYFKYVDAGEFASTATGWGTSFITAANYNQTGSLQKTNGYYAAVGSTKGYELDPTLLEKYDKKMDDGIAGTGNVRAMCISQASYGSASYKESADENKKCQVLLFKVMNM